MFTSTATNANKEEQTEQQKEKIDNETVNEEKIENTLDSIDSMLDRERQKNKTDNWIKLDKTAKLQRLHTFAESYGKQHSMPSKDVKLLKNFFKSCLDKNKLAKSKNNVNSIITF
jgi:monoamine oxidase